MIQFQCDYNEGAHPLIMERLLKTNMQQTIGYGEDRYCLHAAKLIKKACGVRNADVHFLVGGTQTNTTVISSILKPYEGVVCASTGHINVHETGAIEHTGHKVLALPCENGKITAPQIAKTMQEHLLEDGPEHTVKPGLVYLSFPTEIGTIYTKQELTDIRETCDRYELPLFIDGARLGYGLTAEGNDVTLQDIAGLSDVFYIGGTKVGALFGEAVVITKVALKPNFRYYIKQQGGMLAKGRLLGIQFETLMEHNLYFELGAHANRLAMKIKDAFVKKGCEFLVDSPTNQQFPILRKEDSIKLAEQFMFSAWKKVDADHVAVRFCTSWATKEAAVAQLIKAIEAL